MFDSIQEKTKHLGSCFFAVLFVQNFRIGFFLATNVEIVRNPTNVRIIGLLVLFKIILFFFAEFLLKSHGIDLEYMLLKSQ